MLDSNSSTVSGEDENALFEKVTKTLTPYLVTPEEAYRIRTRLARYVQDVENDIKRQISANPPSTSAKKSTIPQPQGKKLTQRPNGHGEVKIPDNITGARRAYLEAVRDNWIVQQQYSSLVTELSSPAQGPKAHAPDQHSKAQKHGDFRNAYFASLRRQDQNAQLQILKHYADEVDLLGQKEGIFKPIPPRTKSTNGGLTNRSEDRGIDVEAENRKLDMVLQKAQTLVRELEMAVIRAHHHVKRERALLEHAKRRVHHPESASTIAKICALKATRAKLTEWIEENLARCADAEAAHDDEQSVKTQNQDIDKVVDLLSERQQKTTEQDVQDEYDEYVETRRQLIEAAAALEYELGQPYNNTANVKTDVESKHAELEKQFTTSETTDILPTLEKDCLPLLQQKKTVQQYHEVLRAQLEQARTNTLALLERMKDESQLLQAYPILARSGRFQNATSTFNSKNVQQINQGGTEDEMVAHIQAWQFAAKAADDTISNVVDQAVGNGNIALERVQINIEDLILLDSAMVDMPKTP